MFIRCYSIFNEVFFLTITAYYSQWHALHTPHSAYAASTVVYRKKRYNLLNIFFEHKQQKASLQYCLQYYYCFFFFYH